MSEAEQEPVRPAAVRPAMKEPARSLYMAATELDRLDRVVEPSWRAGVLFHLAETAEHLPEEALRSIATRYLDDEESAIRGAVCKLLGRSENEFFIPLLELMQDDKDPWVREQADIAIRALLQVAPRVPDAVTQVLGQLSKVEPDSIHHIASSKSSLLAHYYASLSRRARSSLSHAVVLLAISSVMMVVAIGISILTPWSSWVRLVSSGLLVIAAAATLVFGTAQLVRYGRAKLRLASVYHPSDVVSEALTQLSVAETGDILRIARSQMSILDTYYNSALAQQKGSYRAASFIAGIGVLIFFASIWLVLTDNRINVAIAGTIAASIVQVVSGVGFFLYSKSTGQLDKIYQQLVSVQRFLLANSICEKLTTQEALERSRSELVSTIAKSVQGNAEARSPA